MIDSVPAWFAIPVSIILIITYIVLVIRDKRKKLTK